MELLLINTNFFFPVVYINKKWINMTHDIIQCFLHKGNPSKLNECSYKKMAILPWVLKDKRYYNDNELRFLCGDEYDDENGIMGGRIAAEKKNQMRITGLPYKYDDAGISLRKVHIGAHCRKTTELKGICDSKKIDTVQW